MFTDRDIRSLAEVRSDTTPVVSCYLDVDGRRYVRHSDFERVLDTLIRRVRAERDNGGRSAHADDQDLKRIEEFVGNGFDRKGIRGLAIFSCAAIDLWKVVELPVPVRSDIVCNPTPAVGQLESLLHQAEPIGVLLVDKQHVRALVFSLGELIEHTESLSEPTREHDIGVADRGNPDGHRDEHEQQHLRHAAQVGWELLQQRPFAHLVIAAPDAMASTLEDALHPYLKDRFRARLDVEPTISIAALRERIVEVELTLEREREAKIVDSLRDAAAAGDRGVAGLDGVLDALADHRVERLLVSDGYSVAGWECSTCNRLAAVGRTCRCGAQMTAVDNVVDEAIEVALGQSCQVEVCVDNADLDVLGRIGALLRF